MLEGNTRTSEGCTSFTDLNMADRLAMQNNWVITDPENTRVNGLGQPYVQTTLGQDMCRLKR